VHPPLSPPSHTPPPSPLPRTCTLQTARVAMTAGGQQYDPTKFAVSPITGELIAHTDMAGGQQQHGI